MNISQSLKIICELKIFIICSRLSKKILKTKEIESKISTVASTIEELARKNRKDLIQLKSVEDDIKLCIEVFNLGIFVGKNLRIHLLLPDSIGKKSAR